MKYRTSEARARAHAGALSRRRLLAFPALGLMPMLNWQSGAEDPRPLPQTRLLFGGDIMLARGVARMAHERQDPALPLRDLAPLLASADIAFANLESPLSDGKPIAPGHMIFRAEPGSVAALQLAGLDVVSTANNHSRDCGPHGLAFTLQHLNSSGILAAGTGASEEAAHAGVILERNGLRFGFLAYTYDQSNGNHKSPDERIAMLDPARAAGDVRRLRARADVVVVSMHAGVEYSPKPHRSQTEFAKAVVDAGALVVAGHHPHVVQRAERMGKAVVFYSLGNLVFDQFHRRETQAGLLGEVVFRGAAIESWSTIPIRILRTGPTAHPAT